MGLEIPEEFWPITPIKTVAPRFIPAQTTSPITPIERRSSSSSIPPKEEERVVEDEEECHTPKSVECQLLKMPFVCPPAPRKPRAMKRKAGYPTQLYFHVPSDLTSVFLPLVNPSKKIKAIW